MLVLRVAFLHERRGRSTFRGGNRKSARGTHVATHCSMVFILLVVLLVLALGGTAPVWGHSRNWGYGPSGGAGTLLVIVLCVWFFMGRGY